MPDDLMKYNRASDLMECLDPFIALYSSGDNAAGFRKEQTVGAVAALNHLKRLDRPGLSAPEQQRMDHQFRSFAAVAEAGMDTLQGKHISLSLNAVSHRSGYTSLFIKASQRLRALCQRCLSCPARDAIDADPDTAHTTLAACPRCPLDGRSVALSLNALSKAGERDEPLLRDLAEVAAGQRLQGQNAGLILNALARMGFRDEALVRRLSDATRGMDPATLDAQAVANIANALAKLGVLDPPAMARLSAAARALPRAALSSQAIANVVNAFARLGVEDRPLLAHLSAAAMDQPSDSFSPHSIASIVNGFARAGVADGPLFRYLSIAAQRRPPRLFTLQAAYNMVNAYDRAGLTDPRLAAHLAQTVLAADAATLHELAHVAAAFARLEPPHGAVLDHVRRLVACLPAPHPDARAAPTADGEGRRRRGDAAAAAAAGRGQDLGMLLSALVKTGRLDEAALAALSPLIRALPPGVAAAQDVAVMGLALSRVPAAAADAALQEHMVAAAAAALDGAAWPASALAMGLAGLGRFPGPAAEAVRRRMEAAALRTPAAAFEAQDVGNLLNACSRADPAGAALRAPLWPDSDDDAAAAAAVAGGGGGGEGGGLEAKVGWTG
jgi:hypothetical protein